MVDGYQPLTDPQWQVMQPLLPVHGNRRLCLRRVLDAVRYVCRTGCQWRALPATFPAWTAVYYYFRRWQPAVWAHLNEALNRADRLAADRAATPSLVCVDSQSVKLAPRIFEHRGTDGGKHVNGRKRQLVTDAEGRVFACYVHAANGHDGTAATQGLLPRRPDWGHSAWSRCSPTTAAGAALPPTCRPWACATNWPAGRRVRAASCPWPSAGSSSARLRGWPVFGAWPSTTSLPRPATKRGC
ncbi:IS5 family transposase [Hymenobacter sp. B1770]|uniref:IS5 family transposase n=1 Tax=Hymenobacter sp. B1770 TaxID=1718788 RepID=UPI003CF72B28